MPLPEPWAPGVSQGGPGLRVGSLRRPGRSPRSEFRDWRGPGPAENCRTSCTSASRLPPRPPARVRRTRCRCERACLFIELRRTPPSPRPEQFPPRRGFRAYWGRSPRTSVILTKQGAGRRQSLAFGPGPKRGYHPADSRRNDGQSGYPVNRRVPVSVPAGLWAVLLHDPGGRRRRSGPYSFSSTRALLSLISRKVGARSAVGPRAEPAISCSRSAVPATR